MRASLLFMLLVPIVAIRFRSSNPCHDPEKMTPQTFPKLANRFKMEAKTPDARWKMKKALASLTDADLANCGSCDGIGSAEKRAALAAKPVQHKLKKIFYVNPTFAHDRQKSIERKLNATAPGIPVERWNAATGKDATKENIAEFTTKGVQKYVRGLKGHGNPTIAVYLSQARLLKHIYQSDPEGEDVYAIFEDDANPGKNWVKNSLALLDTNVPEDWDIFKIGFWKMGGASKHVSPCVLESKGPQYGNQAYLIRPKSIPRILDQLASQAVYDVDGAMHGGNRHIMKTNNTTGKEEFSTKGIVLYVGPRLVNHGNFGSLRYLFKEDEAEQALGEDEEIAVSSMEKAWPAIEREWDEAVEEERRTFDLHAKVVETALQ